MTIEKASIHMNDKKIRNIPHNGILNVSSNPAKYLKQFSLLCKIFLFSGTKNQFELKLFYIWSHRIVSWWWRMQTFSFFRIRWNTSSEISCPPVSCSVIMCVCLISSSAALSFSSWLQATHTSVAYRLGKANIIIVPKKDAITWVRQRLMLYWLRKRFWVWDNKNYSEFYKKGYSLRKPY
jgi:hypothetical protein